MVSLQPLGGNIVVQIASDDSKTASGIFIPTTASKEKPQQGKVIALGTGRILENGTKVKFTVKVGDVVVFKQYAPEMIKIDEEEYLVLAEADVLAIVK